MSHMTFNGVLSSSLNVTRCVPLIPLLPERTPNTMEIQGRDGYLDFGNDSYKARQIPVDVIVEATSESALVTRLAAVSKWLSGEGYLIFDYDSTKRWYGKVYSLIEMERYPLWVRFTVTFECQPWAEDVTATTDTSLGGVEDYGSDVIFFPTITVTLTADSDSVQVALTSTGEYVLLEEEGMVSTDVIVFDMATGKATLNGTYHAVNILSKWFGIPTGSQTITITTDGTKTVSMSYRKRYFYA